MGALNNKKRRKNTAGTPDPNIAGVRAYKCRTRETAWATTRGPYVHADSTGMNYSMSQISITTYALTSLDATIILMEYALVTYNTYRHDLYFEVCVLPQLANCRYDLTNLGVKLTKSSKIEHILVRYNTPQHKRRRRERGELQCK